MRLSLATVKAFILPSLLNCGEMMSHYPPSRQKGSLCLHMTIIERWGFNMRSTVEAWALTIYHLDKSLSLPTFDYPKLRLQHAMINQLLRHELHYLDKEPLSAHTWKSSGPAIRPVAQCTLGYSQFLFSILCRDIGGHSELSAYIGIVMFNCTL